MRRRTFLASAAAGTAALTALDVGLRRQVQRRIQSFLQRGNTGSPPTSARRRCNIGAASMNGDYFLDYALWRDGKSELLRAKALF